MINFTGGLVVASGVLTLISSTFDFPPTPQVRAIWNIIFGLLILFIQLKWEKFITKRFGFLHHWFLRGIFYVFVGTNVMDCRDDEPGPCVFSVVTGCTCIFVGFVELIFGTRCQKEEPEGVEDSQPGGRAQVNSGPEGPSLTVNVTPAQAIQGASWAAKASSANNNPPPASSGGANPFFGHRT